MKHLILSCCLSLSILAAHAQVQPATMKEYKVGQPFSISLPSYMTKTVGLNSSSAIQFKSEEKDVYGFVIQDSKEEMKLAGVKSGTLMEFYDDFMTDFGKDDQDRKVGTPVKQTKNGLNFIEVDYTYFDKSAEMNIYYFIGIVETKNAFYKVFCWCAATEKAKFKADFQKIFYSVKE